METYSEIFDGSAVLATNSGWSTASNAAQMAAFGGAFALPAGSADSAILISLPPGNYTAQATGNGALIVEAYEVP